MNSICSYYCHQHFHSKFSCFGGKTLVSAIPEGTLFKPHCPKGDSDLFQLRSINVKLDKLIEDKTSIIICDEDVLLVLDHLIR